MPPPRRRGRARVSTSAAHLLRVLAQTLTSPCCVLASLCLCVCWLFVLPSLLPLLVPPSLQGPRSFSLHLVPASLPGDPPPSTHVESVAFESQRVDSGLHRSLRTATHSSQVSASGFR